MVSRGEMIKDLKIKFPLSDVNKWAELSDRELDNYYKEYIKNGN